MYRLVEEVREIQQCRTKWLEQIESERKSLLLSATNRKYSYLDLKLLLWLIGDVLLRELVEVKEDCERKVGSAIEEAQVRCAAAVVGRAVMPLSQGQPMYLSCLSHMLEQFSIRASAL